MSYKPLFNVSAKLREGTVCALVTSRSKSDSVYLLECKKGLNKQVSAKVTIVE